MTKDQLLELKPNYKKWQDIEQEEILEWFYLLGAYWLHSGDSRDSHVELTSGNCSNAFFDCLEVLQYVNLSEILANQLARKIKRELNSIRIDRVIGSPMAAITFAHDVARAIDAPISNFLEKDPKNPMQMLWNRRVIQEDEKVLQIEELITTAHTLNEVERAIQQGNPNSVNFVSIIGTLVHRPAKLPITHYGERKVIALIEQEVWSVLQSECPLCKQGSERFRFKANRGKFIKKDK